MVDIHEAWHWLIWTNCKDRQNKQSVKTNPNPKHYFNGLMNISESFATKVVNDKNAFSLQDHKMSSYDITPC